MAKIDIFLPSTMNQEEIHDIYDDVFGVMLEYIPSEEIKIMID